MAATFENDTSNAERSEAALTSILRSFPITPYALR